MVRFGVIGCGRIGDMHARNLARHQRARLARVFDIQKEAAERTAAATGASIAGDVEELLAAADVDAVLIASSTDTHLDLILKAQSAGKAILCEKPIDLDLARVRAAAPALEGYARPVMIGFNRRFDPSFKNLRDRLAAGEIGKPEQVVITSRDPEPPPVAYIRVSGGLFKDMTIHDFDLARYLLGEIVEVQATGANLIDPAIAEEGDIDAAMITLRAESGALCHINNSRRSTYGYDQRIEAFGEHGMLQAGNRRATTVSFWGEKATECRDPVLHFFIERYQDAYLAEIDHFVDCVEHGGTPMVGFEDGQAALALAEAARQSMDTGRTVRLA